MPSQIARNAYATLITRPSYLAGVFTLAYTLRKTGSIYPLVVLYTESLPESSVAAIASEARICNIILKKTQTLLPQNYDEQHLIAERFADTWTKLRVFELFEYDLVCQLDSDMIICKDMDDVFSHALAGNDWLVANHACVCNVDNDPWAPQDWTRDNCAYTHIQHPSALTSPTQPKASGLYTHHLLSSGTFLFRPSRDLWNRMMMYFDSRLDLTELKFPDQDFLTDFFRERWIAIGWQYNALKTMRYVHRNIWRDEEVRCLHFIVDKPWAKRVDMDGIAGYRGRDGVTHQRWWIEYEAWRSERQELHQTEALEEVEKYVAKPLGLDADENEALRAIGSQAQSFASRRKWYEKDQSTTEQSRL